MDTIFGPLYFVVSWIIVTFHKLYSLVFDEDSGWAWGLSIVSLVVLIRIALIPLFVKQIKATRNMQALQPKMKKIQERYKNDRQRQSEEMMKLYRETGTNPLSSCFPILAQAPFFFALYQVLNKMANNQAVSFLTADLVDSGRNAHIFGAPIAARFMDGAGKVQDLNASLMDVRIVTVVMILMMSASQFYTQRQIMTKNVDTSVKTPFMQQQKLLMYIFPIMFAVFGINFPVGVLVYWLTTNVWTLGQQMYVIKRNPTPGSLAYRQRQEKLRAKGKLKEEPAEAERKKSAQQTRTARQQPKRQTKAQRQAAVRQQQSKQQGKQADESAKRSGGSGGKTSVARNNGKQTKSGRSGQPGQRKGQRPKHPSKK